MPRRLHLIAAALVGALFIVYAGVSVARTLDLLRYSSTPAWLPTTRGNVVRVGQIRPGGPADGVLRSGDEIVAVEGRGVARGFDPRVTLYGAPRPYHLLIRRDGRLLDLTLRTIPFGFSFSAFSLVALVAVSALFLFSGCALLLLRPQDEKAFLLALSFILFSGAVDGSFPLRQTPAWMNAITVAGQTLCVLFWPTLLHFFLVFPERSPLLRRLPRLPRFLYLLPVLLMPAFLWAWVMIVTDPPVGLALATQEGPLLWTIRLVFVAYGLAALASLVLTYRQASVASRRKLRVVVAGTIVGFLPLVALSVTSFLVDLGTLGVWLARVLILWVLLSLLLVPLTFAYAIVRHQVIPIRLMIRRGVRYLLVSRGFYLVEAAVLASVIGFLLTGARGQALDRLGGRADLFATLAVGFSVFGLLQLANRRVMPIIDRRFFRDAYDVQRLMAQIGDAARRLGSIDELLSLAAVRVNEALHPETIAVFLVEEASGNYTCAFPADGAGDQLSAQAPLVESLRRAPQTLETEAGGLNLPIVAKGDLLGILSVGPRMGDLPYSRSDRRLLEAVAWQLAFAIENTRFVRRMAEEERLRREIAMASEVQRRLFPERPPESRRLDLAGICHPAQGVGGDYYDFLSLGDGTIGIAVADVAGKGISAALLMSVVQASLRSQAGSVSPTELVASMNRLLYRSVARNRFASFFYAEFSERTGRLTYVNAGHNPPLLLRTGASNGPRQQGSARGGNGGSGTAVAVEASPATLVRLKTGGLVIGVVQGTTYEQDVIGLGSGDVLLAYTDGVTEAFNAEGEEFGEERLEQVVESSSHLPAAALADAVVQSVRGFCREAPQHDDITLVVAKVK